MKSNESNKGIGSRLGTLCLTSCQKLVAQIRNAKEAILAESRELLDAPDRMLRLALNEAEAMAWQTGYPHLLFPALATEKVRGVADWMQRQMSLQRNHSISAPAWPVQWLSNKPN